MATKKKKTTTGRAVSTTKKPSKKKKDEELFQCSSCGKFKLAREFYKSYNEIYSTGVLPYCKVCIRKMCNDKFNNVDKQKTLRMLRTVDKPYIDKLWIKSNEKGGSNVVGRYLRFLSLAQYRDLKWLDGDLDMLGEGGGDVRPTLTNARQVAPIKTEIEKFEDFELTDDIIKLFGVGYTDEEYFHMNNKYKFLSENYTEQTNMHTEALITYVRYKVKEEMAIASDNPNQAKTWGELAMKQAEKAKINPNQFSKADLQGGLTTIGEIAQAVEQHVDIIPILPKFKYRPNDAVDFCIWNYINYARDLEGKPKIEYKDVYQFYDKTREAYITETGDPYGIFEKDPTLHNREKVEQFIQLPDEYYEEGGDK